MPQSLARRPINFLEMLTANPRGWGLYAPGSPEEGVPDPRQADRAADTMGMLGPFAEYAAPNLLELAADPQGTIKGQAREFAAQVPYLAAGPVLGTAGRLAAAYPKVTTALAGGTAGGAGMFALPSSAGEKPSPKVMKLQEKLRDAGYYTGKIDGLMKRKTQAAKEAFEKDEAKRIELEAKKAEAAAAIKETERQGKEAARKEKERAAGEKRLKEMDENESGFSKAFRDYGPMIGYGLGAIGGIGSRWGMTRAFNKTSREAARKADDLVAGGARDVPSRVGGVNTFWQEGGAKTVPFTAAPKAKHAVKSNRTAPSSTTLYPPASVMSQYTKVRDAAVAGGALGEAYITHQMAEGARAELVEAQQALSQDPSEANIQRMQAARDAVAVWETLSRAGLGVAGGYLGSAPKLRYNTSRPNVAKGEAERLQLDRMINRRPRARAKATGTPFPK